MIDDRTRQSVYFLVGIIVGSIFGFIFGYKDLKQHGYKLTLTDFKNIFKNLPRAFKHSFNLFHNPSVVLPTAGLSILLFALVAVSLLMNVLFFGKMLISLIKRLKGNSPTVNQTKIRPLFQFNNKIKLTSKGLFLISYYGYLAFRNKYASPEKLLSSLFITSKSKFTRIDTIDPNHDILKKDELLKKCYDAIRLALDTLKEHEYRTNIPIFVTPSNIFNAFYDPLNRQVVILFHRRTIKNLTVRELAAILLHELGHAFELKDYEFSMFSLSFMNILELLLYFYAPFALNKLFQKHTMLLPSWCIAPGAMKCMPH
jgi:hypothetical protein